MSGRWGTVKGGYLYLVHRSGQRTIEQPGQLHRKEHSLELIWKLPKAQLCGVSEERGSDDMCRQVVVSG